MKKIRKGWPRCAKAARNLLLALLFALIAWELMDRPLPYGAALRRMERQFLVPETEHTAVIPRSIWGRDARLDWTEGAAIASFPSYGGSIFHIYRPYGQPFPLAEGANLIAMPFPVCQHDEAGQPLTYAAYAALQPPEGSVSASLTLHNDDGTFTVESRRADDIFLFYARPQPDEDGRTSMNSSWFIAGMFSYELTFYDAGGTVVGKTAG